ncbi:MAG TPA: alpha/beta hydrolase [Solirubrobacteraceae bacterium]
MPHADVNGQRLYYEDAGSGEPAVLFSHGFFMDHSMFDPQVQALSDRWRCVTWDERGHGQTETSPDPFTYWDSGKDALGLLDHLGIEQAVLAGMSQGGFLSLRAALTAPDRVRALILIDTQDRPEDPEKVAGYDQLIAAFKAPGGPPQEVLDTVAGIILGEGVPDTERWQRSWTEIPHDTLDQIYTTLTTREDDINARLGELTMPILMIHGEADAAIELSVAERLAGDLPNAELVAIPGAAHAPNLSHPDAVNPHIERFLSSL